MEISFYVDLWWVGFCLFSLPIAVFLMPLFYTMLRTAEDRMELYKGVAVLGVILLITVMIVGGIHLMVNN